MATYGNALGITNSNHYAVNSPSGNPQSSLATLYTVPSGRFAKVTMHYFKTTGGSAGDATNGFVGVYDGNANLMFVLFRRLTGGTLPGTFKPQQGSNLGEAAGDNLLAVAEPFDIGPGCSIRWQKTTSGAVQLDFAVSVQEFSSGL
jgi:hypothetical protein